MGLAGRLGIIPVALGLGLGLLMAAPSSAGTPLATIAGEYAGKVKYKDQIINTEEGAGGTGSVDVGFLAIQEGIFFEAAFLIHGQDEQPDEYHYGGGRAGNGKFWFQGSNGENGTSVTLFGTMKGAEGSRLLKGKGVYLSDGTYSDVKFTLKEGDSGIQL